MVLKSGLGFHNMWGFSPSIDLLDEEEGIICSDESKTTNILLVEPSDPRHIIHTLARYNRKTHNKEKINIYILEAEPEILARHVFLLHVFFDNLQIRQRAALFLEVFGNSLLQEKTEKYVSDAALKLRELINKDDKYKSSLKFLLDFDQMKQRDRDEIDSVFKSWTQNTGYDVVSLRDHRLRGCYGDRYDCRKNLIDWDYYTNVKKVASIIHTRQFEKWRMTGVAFEFGDVVYCKPNRTMSSFTKGQARKGRDCGLFKEYKGFWLDVLIGPYIAFGVEIDDADSDSYAEKLFEVVNGGTGAEQHRHHTVDVAMYNLLGYMWEMETGSKYEMKMQSDIFSGLGEQFRKQEESDEPKPSSASADDGNKASDETLGMITSDAPKKDTSSSSSSSKDIKFTEKSFEGVNIIPFRGDLSSLSKKKKYRNLFKQIHLSQHTAHLLGDKHVQDFLKIGSDSDDDTSSPSIISVESSKYLFALNDKERKAIDTRIMELSSSNNLVAVEPKKVPNSGFTENSSIFKFKLLP